MSSGVCAVPNVLFAAVCDSANCAGKISGPASAFKGDSNGMCIISIFVNKQQSPLSVRAPDGTRLARLSEATLFRPQDCGRSLPALPHA
jgi:hypothetical protein